MPVKQQNSEQPAEEKATAVCLSMDRLGDLFTYFGSYCIESEKQTLCWVLRVKKILEKRL